MPRRLLVLNVVLGLVSLAFAVGIVRSLVVKRPLPAPVPARTAAAPTPAASGAPVEPGPEAFAVIAAGNPFNPGRSETATAAAVSVVKPILHGIVISGTMSRAFLEDPSLKRVSGYSVGDSVGGGRLQKIADDRVVIARPEGTVEVLLQDPSKPRPAAAPVPVVTAVPGQPTPGLAPGQPVPPAPAVSGQLVPPPPPPPPTPQVAPAPAPGAAPTQSPMIPSQLRRRVAPGQPSE